MPQAHNVFPFDSVRIVFQKAMKCFKHTTYSFPGSLFYAMIFSRRTTTDDLFPLENRFET